MKYIHPKPQSIFAKLVELLLPIFKPRDSFKNKAKKQDFISKTARLPFFIKSKFKVTTTANKGRKTWTIAPKKNKTEKVVLFVHGGAYVHSLLIFHWMFIYKFVKQTGATIVVPDYPLAPASNCLDNFTFIGKEYDYLIGNYKTENIILMGDSAGGGFCLSFAQYLAQNNKPQASKLILIAPWLDVSMENPEIKLIEKKDKMLDVAALQLTGKSYADNLGVNHYQVSPIYGEFDNLPEISIFIGGHDILLCDCEKLKKILIDKNIDFNYFEYPKMFHDWVLLTPIKEAKIAFKQMLVLVETTK